MYDELVKRLNKYRAEHESHGGITAEAADAIEELNREKESLEKDVEIASYVMARRWIPVTERLPKESERVLVACEDGVSFGFFEEIIADDEFVKEWHDMMYYPISVTHWMPLPEPPKEEKIS